MNLYDIPFFPTSSSGSGGGVTLPENVATKDDINQLKTEMKSVTNDIQIMQETVNNVNTSNEEAVTAVNEMKLTVEKVNNSVTQIGERVTNIEDQLDSKIDESEEVNFQSSLFS